MPSNASIREQVTKQIVDAIENDNVLPWRRPWTLSKNSGRAANVISKRSYTGINPLLLEIHRLQHGFTSRWYATFRQWSELGMTVKKRPSHVESGDWGARIVFYRPVTKTRVDPATGDEEEDRFFVMRTYSVFSADQVEGAERFQVNADEPTGTILPDFGPADELIAASGADIRHEGDQAYYRRPTPVGTWPNHDEGDFIVLPPKHRFDPPGAYYETAFHELAHHSEVRLGWDSDSHGYAMNELVAEMAASFLSTELGVPQAESLENHAAYLKSWLREMKDDPSFVFKASTQASRVADHLLGFVQQDAENPAPVLVEQE